MAVQKIVLFFHNLATVTWIGGMIFLAFLVVEVEKLGPDLNIVLGKMTKRFSQLAQLSILTLIITRILLTSWRGGMARVQRDLVLNLKHLAILLAIINGAYLAVKVISNLEKTASKKLPEAVFWKKG